VGDALASQNGVLSGGPEHPATETNVSRATREQIVRRKSMSVATHSTKRANYATILTKIKPSLMA
jgi:hypothetical protein